jgi:hypothetical protein
MRTEVSISAAAGLTVPACPGCIARRTPNCGVCGYKRTAAGTVEGRVACQECFDRGTLLDGPCSGCGQVSKHPNSIHCFACGLNRHARKKLVEMEDRLRNDWAKAMFRQFLRDGNCEAAPSSALTLAKRNIEGFESLDRTMPGPDDWTVTGVLAALGDDPTGKRLQALKAWLTLQRGFDFASEEADWFLHRRWVARRIAGEPLSWVREELEHFVVALYADRQRHLDAGYERAAVPLSTKGIELAVKYAQWLMQASAAAGVGQVIGIGQRDVEAYAAKKPLVYQGICAFVRYLNGTSHRLNPLKVPTNARASDTLKHVLDLPTRKRAVARWLAATEGRDLRNSVIALLAYFYMQRLDAVLRLRCDAVSRRDGTHRINFGLGEHELDPDIAAIVERWLAVRHVPTQFARYDQNDLLFPGNMTNQPLERTSFSAWLKETHGILARQLFATAVHGFIDTGLRDPTVLVSNFGLTVPTALRYWRESGGHLANFLYEETLDRMRDEGYFT